MPKKSEATEEIETPEVEEPKRPYFFPTIGEGVTVFAGSEEEAIEMANKLRKDISSTSPQN